MTTAITIKVEHLQEGKQVEVSMLDSLGSTVGLAAVLSDHGSVAVVHIHSAGDVILREVDIESGEPTAAPVSPPAPITPVDPITPVVPVEPSDPAAVDAGAEVVDPAAQAAQ